MTDCIDVLQAPCVFCGHNGPLYWHRGSHEEGCPWRDVGGSDNRAKELRDAISQHWQNERNLLCLYDALMIPRDTDIEEAVRVVRDLHDRVPVGRSFQERIAWAVCLPKDASEDALVGEVCRIKGEFKKAHADWFELFEENKRLRERLQFDPGGSDKIDELEDALAQVKAGAEMLQEELKAYKRRDMSLKDEAEDVEEWCEEKGWRKDCTPRQFLQQLWEAQCEDVAALNADMQRLQTSSDCKDVELDSLERFLNKASLLLDLPENSTLNKVLHKVKDLQEEMSSANHILSSMSFDIDTLVKQKGTLESQLRRLQTGQEIESDRITDTEARQQSEIDALQKALRHAHEKMGPGYSQTGRGELSITTCDGCGESLPEGIEHTWEDCCKAIRGSKRALEEALRYAEADAAYYAKEAEGAKAAHKEAVEAHKLWRHRGEELQYSTCQKKISDVLNLPPDWTESEVVREVEHLNKLYKKLQDRLEWAPGTEDRIDRLEDNMRVSKAAHKRATDFIKFWLGKSESVECPSCHCLLREPPTDPIMSDHHETCEIAKILMEAP